MKKSHHGLKQSGVSLIVVLLFLTAISGISIFAARKATLEEGLGRNQLDMETARLAAESALRDAERDLASARVNVAAISCTRPAIWVFDEPCTNGLCRKADSAYAGSNWKDASPTNLTVSEPWWPLSKGGRWNDNFNGKPSRTPVTTVNCDFTGAVPLGTYTGAPAVGGVAIQPEYIIEYFQKKVVGGQEADAFRITARGFGYSRRTQSVMQSVFLAEE